MLDQSTPSTKACSKCGVVKPLSSFQKKGGRRRRSECRLCSRSYAAAYRSRNKDQFAAWCRDWREKHPEYQREWHAQHPDYQEGTKDHVRHAVRTIRIRRLGLEDGVSKEQWDAIVVAYCGRCVYCGSEEAVTQDHIVPIKKGGLHVPANVVPACKDCNRRKGAKIVDLPWEP